MIDEIRVDSWSSALEQLYEDDFKPEIHRHRSSFAFRGMTEDWSTMPTSLARLGGNYAALEPHLLRNFRKYAHRQVVERDSFWHWLTMGQHHGLPTRLLDWTYSPLVALHFATDNLSNMNKDGVVWAVDIDNAHSMLPKALRTILEQEGSAVFTVDLLGELSLVNLEDKLIAAGKKAIEVTLSTIGASLSLGSRELEKLTIKSIPDLDRISKDLTCIFLEPPSIDDRVVNQFALFSVLNKATASMDQWIKESDVRCKKVIIPSEVKWEIRDRLDQANVSERSIYPGLEGLSRWLKRHYSQGPKT
jgi:FRG domain